MTLPRAALLLSLAAAACALRAEPRFSGPRAPRFRCRAVAAKADDPPIDELEEERVRAAVQGWGRKTLRRGVVATPTAVLAHPIHCVWCNRARPPSSTLGSIHNGFATHGGSAAGRVRVAPRLSFTVLAGVGCSRGVHALPHSHPKLLRHTTAYRPRWRRSASAWRASRRASRRSACWLKVAPNYFTTAALLHYYVMLLHY